VISRPGTVSIRRQLFQRGEHCLVGIIALGGRSNHSPGHPMRLALNVVGILCLLMGGVWFLQGINILPGSFMTGQTKWAVYGGVLLVVGLGVLVMANRRRV
jgi:hypothetical protein